MTTPLSELDTINIILKGKIGRLGCIDNDEPYVVPINYFLDGTSILSHSLPGKKIYAMRANPRVCLQVDQIQDHYRWRSAIAFGRFVEIDRPAERRSVIAKLLSRFPQLTPVESAIVHDAAAPDSVVFRIEVDRFTGVEEE